jgi:cobalamin synthase
MLKMCNRTCVLFPFFFSVLVLSIFMTSLYNVSNEQVYLPTRSVKWNNACQTQLYILKMKARMKYSPSVGYCQMVFQVFHKMETKFLGLVLISFPVYWFLTISFSKLMLLNIWLWTFLRTISVPRVYLFYIKSWKWREIYGVNGQFIGFGIDWIVTQFKSKICILVLLFMRFLTWIKTSLFSVWVVCFFN